jgi:hypothetical protein
LCMNGSFFCHIDKFLGLLLFDIIFTKFRKA